MSFINNPFGNAGYSPAYLGNLTSGVESLQKTEIERELKSIQQNKQWERDDRLRNQALALQFSAPSTLDGLRQSQTESFMKKKDAYTEMAAKVFSSNKTPETKDLMMLQTERQRLLNETMQEKAFSDAFMKMQSQAPAMRKSLETEQQRNDFDRQIADFTLRLKDPKQKVEVYDLIEAFRTPEPPVSFLLSEFDKLVVPKLKGSVKQGSAYGTTTVDSAKALEVVRANADPYMYQKGVEEKRWSTPEEMEQVLLKRVTPYVSVDVTASRAPQGRAPKELDVIEEIPTEVKSVVATTPSGKGVVITRPGRPLNVTVGEDESLTGSKFIPTQFIGGKMQGKFEGEQYVKLKNVEIAQYRREAQADTRIKITNAKQDADGEWYGDVVKPELKTWYGEVDYSTIRDQVKDRYPEVDRMYQESTKKAPVALTAAQNKAIDKLVKLNPTMTREQIIKQVIK
jgi:hypothetical protein